VSLILLSPIGVLLLDKRALRDPIRRAAFKGLLIYAFICTSDGALPYIPVIAFYWFTYMIYLFGLPGTQPSPLVRQESEPVSAFPQVLPLST
jgi:hypothetical protein